MTRNERNTLMVAGFSTHSGSLMAIFASDGIPAMFLMRTLALCGFSNFGAIGIQIGGIGPLAPERPDDLAQLGLRAMFGGMLAACMTAFIAGFFYGVLNWRGQESNQQTQLFAGLIG